MPPRLAAAQGQPTAPVAAPSQPTVAAWVTDRRGQTFTSFLVIALFVLMVVPEGLDYVHSTMVAPLTGSAGSRLVWIFLLTSGLYVLASHASRTLALLRHLNPFLLAFVVLASVSVTWSIEPVVTVRRVYRVFTIVTVCCSFAVAGWYPKRFQVLARGLLTAILVASIIMVMIWPEYAIHHTQAAELSEAWHGITTGKNLFGSLASACIVVWLHGLLTREVRPIYALAGLGIAVFCLIMSRSSTSLMATMFAVVFLLILMRPPQFMRRSMPFLIALFAGIILIYSLAVLRLVPGLQGLLAPITMITGKDLTFTGRTNIWYVLNEHIRLSPWLGTGYGAYWTGPIPSSASYEMLARLSFYPQEGHNGYLDLINDLGAVGGFCLLGYFIYYIRESLYLMKVDRATAALYLTLLFRGFLADMSESHWFNVLSIDFVVLTFATVALAQSVFHYDTVRGFPGQHRARPVRLAT